jgi:hypothetical protein
MHEQGGLDERQDFGDAEVVSGMRKTHGKKGAKNGGAGWRILAGKKLKVAGFGGWRSRRQEMVKRSSKGILTTLTCFDDGLKHATALGAQSSGTTAKTMGVGCARDAGMISKQANAMNGKYVNYSNFA